MAWSPVRDFPLYAILGLLALIPITTLVAAYYAVSLRRAFDSTRAFLEKWAAVAPGGLPQTVFKLAAGVSVVLVLLAALAYATNRFGDVLLPVVARPVNALGNPYVQWSSAHPKDWNEVKYDYRQVTGIRGDDEKWEAYKAQRGRLDVRFARTLVVLCAFGLLGALVDLVRSSRFRKRGLGGLFLWGLGVILFLALWVEREGKFTENLLASYREIYQDSLHVPPPWPASYIQAFGGR